MRFDNLLKLNMSKFSKTAIIVSLLALGSSACTHTARFAEPEVGTKNFAPANTRNFENYLLEKELSFSRTTRGACAVLSGIGVGLVFYHTNNNQSEAVFNDFVTIGAGGVCAYYFNFLVDRAEIYLNAAGVKIEF